MQPDTLKLQPILVAVAVATAGVVPAFLIGGLAVQVRGELEFGAGALGLAVAAFFGFSALMSALMGRVVERLGSHRGMRLAAAGSALSLLGIAVFAHSWSSLVICLMLGGLASAVAQPAANLSLAREVPARRQGLSFGIKQAAIPISTLLAGLTVPTLAVTVGWRWAFAGAAGLALLVAALVPAERVGNVRRATEARAGDVRVTPMVLLAIGTGLGATAATPLGAFTVESAVVSGLRVETAGLLLAVGSAFSIVVRIFFGHLADRMSGGRLRMVAVMLGIGVVGFVLLSTEMSSLLVVGTLLAFGAGWGWPGIFNFAIVKTNPNAPAAATGITQTGVAGGAALGPLIFGFVVEGGSYGTAWMVCGAVALAALAAILTGRHMLLRDRAAVTEAKQK